MNYCIKNNNNVYIKLDSNGRPVTCVESVKGIFEYSKARNILDHLPKTMKKFHFKVEAIPEIVTKEKEKNIEKETVQKKSLQKENYIPSESITRWVEKFGICEDIFNEAKQREEELVIELQNIDKEFLDVLHIIELEKPKDLFGGWKLYKRIKANREQRRYIKDELLIIEDMLKEINPANIQRKRVQKAIDGLLGRKYTFRIVEEDIDDADL